MSLKPIKDMSTKEIVDEFNKITGSKVSRFATRSDAERRLEKARTDPKMRQTAEEKRAEGKKKEKLDDAPAPAKKAKATKSAGKKSKATKSTRSPKAKKAPTSKEAAARSKNSSKSWDDPKTRKARSQRNSCTVSGGKYKTKTTFVSVPAAFRDIGIPFAKCLPFRIVLKKEKRGTYEWKGTKYTFNIIDRIAKSEAKAA